MNYEQIVYDYIKNNYNKLLREPDGIIRHKLLCRARPISVRFGIGIPF